MVVVLVFLQEYGYLYPGYDGASETVPPRTEFSAVGAPPERSLLEVLH